MNTGKQQDKRLEEKDKTKEKMRKMLTSVPNTEDFGFSRGGSGGWQIFTVIYFLTEHLQRLNKLTWALIGLTTILIGAAIGDIIVRVA